ncbi:hypothetical protein [Parasutterella sp.]|uniref:hypothetical protein n=1 Tax=Parasutterella sp. TaxID=2049037 RepID=UPI00307BD9DC
MLKALVQLFAESFLRSKKSWVSAQALPAQKLVSISVTNGGTYVAPCDGWVRLGNSSITRAVLYTTVASSTYVQEGALCYAPIRKGETATFFFNPETAQTEAFFIPAVGSN